MSQWVAPSAAVLSLALGAIGQQAPVFRATTDVVPLQVSVTTDDGRPVTGLQASDFEVRDNGRRATVAGFTPPPQTVVAKLLLADTRRMNKHLRAAQTAAEVLFAQIDAPDRASIATFSEGVSPLISDRAVLLSAVHRVFKESKLPALDEERPWRGLDGARIDLMRPLDTVLPAAFQAWTQPGNYRWSPGVAPDVRALILLSDGMDFNLPEFKSLGRPSSLGSPGSDERMANDFWRSLPETNDKHAADAVRSGVIVFGFGFEGTADDKRLLTLTTDSSGWFVQPDSKTVWSFEMTRLIEDLRWRYVIGFIPTSFDGSDHKLEVRVNRPGSRVRARAFYQAPTKAR
jgi:hypothetical protein